MVLSFGYLRMKRGRFGSLTIYANVRQGRHAGTYHAVYINICMRGPGIAPCTDGMMVVARLFESAVTS